MIFCYVILSKLNDLLFMLFGDCKNGFLFLDKPSGVSSFHLVNVLRKKLDIKRVGFAGTLDPLASGLMIFAVGRVTKMLQYLEGMDKGYEVLIKFGMVSDTYDLDGKVIFYDIDGLVKPKRNEIEQLIGKKFLGEIDQIPPKFSAIHVNGKRAYDLAREGIEFELKKRKVMIYEVKILKYVFPELRLILKVSKGTYIRSFVNDLGRELRVGAVVSELRRISIGKYKVNKAVKIEDIDLISLSKIIKRVDEVFDDWPKIEITSDEEVLFLQGRILINRWKVKGDRVLGMKSGKVIALMEVLNDGKEIKFKFWF